MRKNVFGRKLTRDKNERKALFKGLMSSLVRYGRITTTQGKAKAIKGQVDKLITKAKKRGNLAVNDLSLYLTPEAIKKLIAEIVPKNAQRNSGYTRIIRVGARLKDSAQMAIMEWVENEELKIENGKLKTEDEKPATTRLQLSSQSDGGQAEAQKKGETQKRKK